MLLFGPAKRSKSVLDGDQVLMSPSPVRLTSCLVEVGGGVEAMIPVEFGILL